MFYLLSCPGAEAPLFCGASEQGQASVSCLRGAGGRFPLLMRKPFCQGPFEMSPGCGSQRVDSSAGSLGGPVVGEARPPPTWPRMTITTLRN